MNIFKRGYLFCVICVKDRINIKYNFFSGEDWPGFDVPAVRSESLWDSEYNPVGNNRWPSPDTSPSGGVRINYTFICFVCFR